MTTYWAVPMYKFLGYRDTILDKYEPLKVRSKLSDLSTTYLFNQ